MAEVLSSLPDYSIFMGLSLALLIGGSLLYSLATPYDEFALIREGNSAASVAFVGAIIGLGLVINSVSHGTHEPLELIAWSAVGLLVQIVTFYIVSHVLFRDMVAKIKEDCTAHGVILGGISAAVGLLNAGALSA